MRKYNVLVCGGGTAGMIAAAASARSGARTLLIEREGYLGGTATYGIPFLGFYSGDGSKVVGGLPQELVDRMVSVGGSKGHMRGGEWREKLNEQGNHEFSLTPFDPECLKSIAQEILLESGVEMMLQATLCDVDVRDKQIISLELMTVEGKKNVDADYFIDCSGDALLTRLAGFPTEMRGRGNMQNVTNIIRLGNVDSERMLDGLKSGTRIGGLEDWHIRIVRGALLDGSEGIVHIAGHAEAWAERMPLTFTGISWRREEMSFNITRTVNIDPCSANDITSAEISERKNIADTVKALTGRVPGFEKAYLVSSSSRVGIREGRRIRGEFTLSEEDVLRGTEFPDAIARGAYPIDIHDPNGGKTQFSFIKEGGSYGVPYRCLIPEDSINLLVAGRCVSTTGKALGSVRLMACCMAMGQAAGSAAALAAKQNIQPGDLSPEQLRARLVKDGAILQV